MTMGEPSFASWTLVDGETGIPSGEKNVSKYSMKVWIVRATLPPSTLFADRALLRRGYSISEPNALVETVSKYKGLY